MKLKGFVSLVIITIIYSISIIIGLILGVPLLRVFITGLILSIFIGISTFIIITGIEFYLGKKVEVDVEVNNENNENNDNLHNDKATDEFSPLNPPILELEKETHG